MRLRKSHHWPFDMIVGVSRGGLVPTRILSDLLDIHDVLITKCEYYSDVAETAKTPKITQKIQGSLRGKNVLLVDDVSDTGKSLIAINKYLRSKRPKTLTVATLYLKPWTKVVPDFYVKKTNAWIIFPWELYEAVKSLSKKISIAKIRKTQIPDRYLSLLRKMTNRSHNPESQKRNPKA
jgi:uncharacterized protein